MMMNDDPKRFFFFAENRLNCISRKINLPVSGKYDVLFAKSEKNPIPSFFSKKNYFGFLFIFFYKGILYKINPDQISRGKSYERKRNKKKRKENKRKKEKKRKDWLVLQKRKH